MAKKEGFAKMWEYIEIPFYLLVLWTALSVFFPMTNYVGNVGATIINLGVLLFGFGYIGFNAVSKNETLGFGVSSGAVGGALLGLAGAVISIFTFYLYPQAFAETISLAMQQAASQGQPVSEEQMKTFIQIGVYIGLITAPIINAIIGTIFGLIGAGVGVLLKPKDKPKEKAGISKKASKKK